VKKLLSIRPVVWTGLLVLIGSLWLPAFAQEGEGVSFSTQVSKERLGLNERLKVTFSMNKDGDNFSPPNFDGFDILMGPTQYISSSFINGQRSYSKSYSYTLRPKKKGSFTIGQASITIDGKTYKTSPVSVTITRAVDNPNAPPTPDQLVDKGIFLLTEVSNTNPYLNEAISVTYKLYIGATTMVDNFNAVEQPKFPDFWSQNIPIDKYIPENTTYKGEPFRSVVLSKAVLYPQKSGVLNIEPMSIDVFVRVPTNRRDYFGRREYVSATKRVTAPARTIRVKPLPTQGRPDSFDGAVGQFEFEVSPSRTLLEATESMQVEVKVSGKGNLQLFQLPQLVLPSSLEVYEPELDQDIRTRISGQSGSVSQTYTVIPQYGGRYPIPPVEFSYFDPVQETYRTLKSEDMTIEVNGNAPSGEGEGPERVDRNLIAATDGNTFHFIRIKPVLRNISHRRFLGSLGFYLGIALPLLSIPLVVWWRRKHQDARSDLALMQRKKAEKLVRKYLSDAKAAMDSEDNFYIALEKALHNFVKARLNLDTVQMSKDQIREEFTSRGLTEELIQAFIELLETCEIARYSPVSQVDMQRAYDRAADVIPHIDKSL